MACACRTAREGQTVVAVAAGTVPHEVKPGESCIFCACKHVSTAYTELYAVRGGTDAAIGELELARRHTAVEFPRVSSLVAAAELAVLLRQDAAPAFEALRPVMLEAVKSADPESTDAGAMLPEFSAGTVLNPFIGELHLCAAYRLAFEVGYMGANRDMIIGDLAIAREHLSRFDNGLMTQLRELRHRVQTATSSDVNIYWPYVCRGAGKLAEKDIASFREEYARGLAEYIGAEIIPGV